jgi:hypothetical protein
MEFLATNDVEALKMVGDWSKWLITTETGSIAVLGGWVTKDPLSHTRAVLLLVTAALGSFASSQPQPSYSYLYLRSHSLSQRRLAFG